MKVQSTTRRLAVQHDGEELRRAARDVGHELPRRRLDVLAEFRSALAKLDAKTSDDFVNGYRAALADVVAAYESALGPALELEQVNRMVREAKHWPETIELMRERPLTPTEVSDGLGVSLPTASRILRDLREAGIVELCRGGGDQRARPQQLTSLGMQVVVESGAVPATTKWALQGAIVMFGDLVTRRGFYDGDLQRAFGPGASLSLFNWFKDAVANHGLAFESKEDGGRFIAEAIPNNKLTAELEALAQYSAPPEHLPDFLMRVSERVEAEAGDATLLVRADGSRDLWVQALAHAGKRADGHLFSRAHVIDRVELELETYPDIRGGQVALLYESVALCKSDLENFKEQATHLQGRAALKLCVATQIAPESIFSAGWEPIRVE